MITFSNPRLAAEFTDWPLGGNKRGVCTFRVESHPKRGHRFVRQTTGKPKTATYGGLAAIVDGSDGRTYLLQFAGIYDFIEIRSSDFMTALPDVVGKNPVWPEDEGGHRFQELKALILQANGKTQ